MILAGWPRTSEATLVRGSAEIEARGNAREPRGNGCEFFGGIPEYSADNPVCFTRYRANSSNAPGFKLSPHLRVVPWEIQTDSPRPSFFFLFTFFSLSPTNRAESDSPRSL